MSDDTVQEAAQTMTREDLFPEPKPEAAIDEEAEARAEASDDLAEAQDEEGQGEEEDATPEAALGKVEFNEFLKAAGVSLEEGYRDIEVPVGDQKMSVSKLVDSVKTLKDAQEALLRERTELQEKVNSQAVQVPQPGISPEAQQLLMTAQTYEQAITANDWSGMDPGAEAKQKQDLMIAANQLRMQAQQKQAEHEQKLQVQLQNAVEEADRQTRSMIPEWNDVGVRDREWKGIADWMTAEGLTQTDINRYSPKERRFLRKAHQAVVAKQRVAEGAKKVRKVSKTTLGAGNRDTTQPKPDLKSAKKQIQQADNAQARQKARLTVPLG